MTTTLNPVFTLSVKLQLEDELLDALYNHWNVPTLMDTQPCGIPCLATEWSVLNAKGSQVP